MPLYLTEYGYFAVGQAGAARRSTRPRYLQQAYSIALKNSARARASCSTCCSTLPSELGVDVQHRHS